MAIEEHPVSPGGRRPYFVPEIKLDSMITLVVTLVGVGVVYGTLKSDINSIGRDIERLVKVVDTKVDKEVAGKGEMELSRRIVEQQQSANAALVRIDEGFREIKGMIRDLDVKLDHKADKPGR